MIRNGDAGLAHRLCFDPPRDHLGAAGPNNHDGCRHAPSRLIDHAPIPGMLVSMDDAKQRQQVRRFIGAWARRRVPSPDQGVADEAVARRARWVSSSSSPPPDAGQLNHRVEDDGHRHNGRRHRRPPDREHFVQNTRERSADPGDEEPPTREPRRTARRPPTLHQAHGRLAPHRSPANRKRRSPPASRARTSRPT